MSVNLGQDLHPSRWSRRFLTLAFVLFAGSVETQPEDLMQREIDQALERTLWELGPFHLTPNARTGVGYDSNAVLTGDSAHPDVNAIFAPSLGAVVTWGDRVLIGLYEELDFVYYRDLVALRDVFNVTRAGGAFGGKSVLTRVESEYREEKVRPTREFDVPVDQSSNLLNASVDLTVGWRHQLSLEYERYRVDIADSELTVQDVPIESLLDRVEEAYGLKFTRHLSADTAVFAASFFGTQRYDDQTVGRDAESYGIVGGFLFSPTGNLSGEAELGWKRLNPDSPAQPGFRGMVGNANVTMRLGERYSLQGHYFRDTAPSLLRENLFFVATVYGASLDIHIARRFSIRPAIVSGSNSYPDGDFATTSEELQAVLIRHINALSLELDHQVTPEWLLRVGASFSMRETSSPSAPEERFVVYLGLTTSF